MPANDGGYQVVAGGQRRFVIALIGVSAIVCVPIAGLASAFLLHAPDRWAYLYPWIWLFGTWLAAWLLFRAGLWLVALLLLAFVTAFFAHGLLQFEPP